MMSQSSSCRGSMTLFEPEAIRSQVIALLEAARPVLFDKLPSTGYILIT